MNKKIFDTLKTVLSIIAIVLFGIMGLIFFVLLTETVGYGFFYQHANVAITVFYCVVTCCVILFIVFIRAGYRVITRLLLIGALLVSSASVIIYLFNSSGFFDKINSVEKVREYVESFGDFAIFHFILIQFLQVTVLPIPSFITVAAGVLLFGPLKGAIYSCIGIISGSLVAFYIGKVCGYKVVSWIVGKETLDKGIKLTKGKDKIIFSFMFLFPFFPDDLLCFVAGIIKLKSRFFVCMVTVTRIIAVFTSAYSVNNQIIPYNTWWGILIWVLFFAFIIICSVFIYKHGDKFKNPLKKQKNK